MIEQPQEDVHLFSKRYIDFTLAFDLVDDDGVAADLTSCYMAMQLRTSFDAASAALTLNSGTGGGIEFDKVVPTPFGSYTCSVYASITLAQLAALPYGVYVYDIVLTDSAGKRHFIFGGKFNHTGAATQVGAP